MATDQLAHRRFDPGCQTHLDATPVFGWRGQHLQFETDPQVSTCRRSSQHRREVDVLIDAGFPASCSVVDLEGKGIAMYVVVRDDATLIGAGTLNRPSIEAVAEVTIGQNICGACGRAAIGEGGVAVVTFLRSVDESVAAQLEFAKRIAAIQHTEVAKVTLLTEIERPVPA